MKKPIVITIIVLSVLVVFFAGTTEFMIIFNDLQNNPLDKLARKYIIEETTIQEEYGEITHIGRAVFGTRKKDQDSAIYSYGCETKENDVFVKVNMEFIDGEWKCTSYEVYDVMKRGRASKSIPF